MNKLFDKKIYVSFLALGAMLLPHSTFAAKVFIETAHTEFFVGDTILVDIKVDSEDKEINTVEGKISLNYLPEAVLIKDINLSESSFSLWPNKPLLSEDLKAISFVGGVPSGLKSDDATLFRVVLNLNKSGTVALNPTNISVYLNDGKGTKDALSTESLVIDVLPKKTDHDAINDLETLISEDKTPPNPFKILAGKDDSIFEGKKFLSFDTTDAQSGIKYYEVIEDGSSPVRSGGTYVLLNQDTSVKVTVLAYDAAGNMRKSVYGSASYNIYYSAILILVVLASVFVIYRRKKPTGR